MKENKLLGITVVILAIATLLSSLALWGLSSTRKDSLGRAANGLIANHATSSTFALSSSSATLFATSTCVSRIVTTKGAAIRLTFRDKYTPSDTLGLLQSASTTVAYDADIYGCGAVKGYSYAAQDLTIAETQ